MRDHFCFSFSYVASLREKLEWEYFPRANEEFSSSVFRFLFFFNSLLALSDQPGAEEVTGSVSRVLYGTIFTVHGHCVRTAWGMRFQKVGSDGKKPEAEADVPRIVSVHWLLTSELWESIQGLQPGTHVFFSLARVKTDKKVIEIC